MPIYNLFNVDETDVTEGISDKTTANLIVSSLMFEDGNGSKNDFLGNRKPSLLLCQQIEATTAGMRTIVIEESSSCLYRNLSWLTRNMYIQ